MASPVRCGTCGREELCTICCPNGHYICEECHNAGPLDIIGAHIDRAQGTDPVAMALPLLDGRLPPLGCHHAYLAAGALYASLKNAGTERMDEHALREIHRRTAKQAVGGYCGLTGVCGIVPAVGAVFAVLLDAHCGTKRRQRAVMDLTAELVLAIAELTGPSCCRAYTIAALQTSVIFLRDRLGILLKSSRPAGCPVSDRHPHGCREDLCPYRGF